MVISQVLGVVEEFDMADIVRRVPVKLKQIADSIALSHVHTNTIVCRLIPTGSSIAESYQHSNVVKVELGRVGTGQPAAVEMIQDYTGSCLNPEYYFRWVPTYACALDTTAIDLTVAGGVGPFTWAVSGSDFTLAESSTAGRTNTATAVYPATIGDTAIVTVTDNCGNSVSGSIKACYEVATPPVPPLYDWIIALFTSIPPLIGKINYTSGAIEDNGTIDITPAITTAPGYDPIVYGGYLYAAYKDASAQFILVKFELATMTVEDTLVVIPTDSYNYNFPMTHCLSGNTLYIGAQSLYGYPTDPYRERVYEVNLDSFTVVRHVGFTHSYGSVHTIIATETMLYVFLNYGVYPVYLSDFSVGTYCMIENLSANKGVVGNNASTEAFVTVNEYTVYRVSLADPPIILDTKSVLFLTANHSVMSDEDNYAYFSDKTQAKIYRLNMSLFDDFVEFDDSGSGLDAPWGALKYAQDKGFFVNNHTWDSDVQRKIVKIDLATMGVDAIISLPVDPYISPIHSIIFS